MCGRYTLTTPPQLVRGLFHLSEVPRLGPRFNIAPTQETPVIRRLTGERRLDLLRWGLVPPWAEKPSNGMINARAETAATKPSFRSSFRRRRCLVLADGFYEWRKAVGDRKQPFYFQLPDGQPFALAGLWERWERGVPPFESFTILTTEANQIVGRVHPRMPVMLRPGAHSAWLDPDLRDADLVTGLLEGGPMGELICTPVSTWVNNPANDSPRCIVTLAPLEEIA